MMLFLLACAVPRATDAPLDRLVADAGPDRVVPVGVSVKLDGSASQGVAFAWQSGDARSYDSAAPTLIYNTPGTYTATLTVSDEQGAVQRDTTTVFVHPRQAEIPSYTSSTIQVDDQGRVSAIVADANARVRIDGDQVERTDACTEGAPVALTSNAVLCQAPASVRFDDGRVMLPLGSRPGGMVPVGSSVVVSLRGTHQLATVVSGGEPVYTDTVVDPRSLVSLQNVPLAARFRSDSAQGEVGEHLLAFDPGPDTDTGSRGVPNLLTLAASADGRTIYAAGTLSNVARGTLRDGQDLSFETTVRGFLAMLTSEQGEQWRVAFDNQGRVGALAVGPLGLRVYVVFPTTRTVFVVDPFSGNAIGSLLDVGHGISGLAVSADGSTLYLNAELSREVRAYDVTDLSGLPPLLWSVSTVLDEPLTADVLLGKKLFNDSTPALSKHGYIACATCHPDGDHDGQTWDFTGRGEGLRNTTSLLGRAGTGMGPVHWTGNFDEIQDFEHDIRGPFQGNGLMADADFLASDTPLGPLKAGRSHELDALAAYVTTLDRTPRSPHAAPAGGEEAFVTAGCEDCHAPPLYTDSALDNRHDIGTLLPSSGTRLGEPLDGIDTPTLLGAWDGAPWLHDGSAASVRAAIEAHDSAPTNPHTLDLLAGFVESL